MSNLGGCKYIMILVDDCTRLKIVKFLNKQSEAISVLHSFLTDSIMPENLIVGVIRRKNGGEFEGDFQGLLDRLGITHEHTPSDTPRYNGVAKRALTLLREKATALIQDLKESPNDRLWAEAMNYACNLTNMSRTTSNDDVISLYEEWYGTTSALDQLQPSGRIEYIHVPTRKHNLAPSGEKFTILGIAATPQVVPPKYVT